MEYDILKGVKKPIKLSELVWGAFTVLVLGSLYLLLAYPDLIVGGL